MRKISTKYILYKMCAHHAQHLCTSTSWNVPKDVIHGMYQSYAFINMPTCASTNMPTMHIHQYANHVHLPTCQTMYHITRDMSPSWTKCHNHVSQTNANCCANQVVPIKHMPYMSVPNITMHQYQKMMNPIFVCQILHKTCANQTASRFLFQCTRKLSIVHQL